jgi:type VI secretion system protein ImpH
MRDQADSLTFFQALAQAPYRHDFYQTLRRVECLHPGLPRIGQALRPADEPIRLAQEPALTFAPAALSSFGTPPGAAVPRLQVRFFGLLGPNGPLPLHMTELVRERVHHAGDPTLAAFLDLFHHRFLSLFYRAWAQAQPTVSLDRPREDRFSYYTGALCGIGDATLRGRDAVPDFARLFHAGLLARHVRNGDGLVALLTGYFRIPVTLEPFVGHWMTLPPNERTRLGTGAARGYGVGGGAVLGGRVWDRQHKFRLCLGPLDLAGYESFLPGGAAHSQLLAWVRHYLTDELAWDVRLVLRRGQVPPTRPGRCGRLGWTTWLGTRPHQADAADLLLAPERGAAGGPA